ncbi:MAG: hypothetical protein V3U79_02085 [Dehalococcoidia bacterium]
MAKGIMERLSEGVVLGDGGCVQELGKRGVVQEGPYSPEVIFRYLRVRTGITIQANRAKAQEWQVPGGRRKLRRIHPESQRS